MSTCPEKDILSIYIDGELPAKYQAEVESHLSSCEKCRKELEALRKIQAVLKKDSKNIELTQEEMDKSYERLMARLSYSKVTNAAKETSGKIFKFLPASDNSTSAKEKKYGTFKYIAGAVAAAAVFALIIPVRISKTATPKSAAIASFTPVATTQFQPTNLQQVKYDGPFQYHTMGHNSQLPGMEERGARHFRRPFNNQEESIIPAFNTQIQNNQIQTTGMPKLPDYDVFCPIDKTENINKEKEENQGFQLNLTTPFFTLQIGSPK